MRGSMLVKGKQFDSSRVVGNVYQAASIHQARGVDELIVLDVAATMQGVEPNPMVIKELTGNCFMPITVGGGIKTVMHVRELLANGADKVVIGTAALEDPALINRCATKFGSQAITVAVDAVFVDGNWFITKRCGTEYELYSPVAFALDMQARGAGELMVTAIKNDGMMCGYDLGLIRKISKAVEIPVIASGGAGSYRHMHAALKAGASAVAAGAMFQWTDATPHGAAEYLSEKGWEIRL
jgi:cyclase